jgi:hypothetical protein
MPLSGLRAKSFKEVTWCNVKRICLINTSRVWATDLSVFRVLLFDQVTIYFDVSVIWRSLNFGEIPLFLSKDWLGKEKRIIQVRDIAKSSIQVSLGFD